MSQSQVQVNVEKEVSQAMEAVVALVTAIKAKKLDLSTEVSVAIQFIGAIPQVANDIKVDLPGSLNSVLLGAVQLGQVLLS